MSSDCGDCGGCGSRKKKSGFWVEGGKVGVWVVRRKTTVRVVGETRITIFDVLEGH